MGSAAAESEAAWCGGAAGLQKDLACLWRPTGVCVQDAWRHRGEGDDVTYWDTLPGASAVLELINVVARPRVVVEMGEEERLERYGGAE